MNGWSGAVDRTCVPRFVTFIEEHRDALIRPVPDRPVPFSTPRAWASLARALDLVEARGNLRRKFAWPSPSAGSVARTPKHFVFCRADGWAGVLFCNDRSGIPKEWITGTDDSLRLEIRDPHRRIRCRRPRHC